MVRITLIPASADQRRRTSPTQGEVQIVPALTDQNCPKLPARGFRNFLDLPAELRHMVILDTLSDNRRLGNRIWLHACKRKMRDSTLPIWFPAISYTSKQMRDEAGLLFLRNNTFVLADEKGVKLIRKILNLFPGRQGYHAVKKLSIAFFTDDCHNIHTQFKKAVPLIKACPYLTRLEILIYGRKFVEPTVAVPVDHVSFVELMGDRDNNWDEAAAQGMLDGVLRVRRAAAETENDPDDEDGLDDLDEDDSSNEEIDSIGEENDENIPRLAWPEIEGWEAPRPIWPPPPSQPRSLDDIIRLFGLESIFRCKNLKVIDLHAASDYYVDGMCENSPNGLLYDLADWIKLEFRRRNNQIVHIAPLYISFYGPDYWFDVEEDDEEMEDAPVDDGEGDGEGDNGEGDDGDGDELEGDDGGDDSGGSDAEDDDEVDWATALWEVWEGVR